MRALLSAEGGYSLVELISVMAILGTVLTSVTVLLVAGTHAEVDMNKRFQAQTQARIALDRLRRETHCATSATPPGASATVTLTMPVTCPTSAGQTSITWCTVASGSSYELWRYLGSSCSGTGTRVAEHLTAANAFNYAAATAESRGKLGIALAVNTDPSEPQSTYLLEDDIVLRNSARL